MQHLIEQYNDQCALWEDEDGLRWFHVGALSTPEACTSGWDRAKVSGAVGLITVRDGQLWIWTKEEYDQDGAGAGFDPDDFPSYHEVKNRYQNRNSNSSTSGFVHLHTHSEYSPLDGLSKVSEIVAEIKNLGQEAVAVTDHGTCAAHPAMFKACQEAGIRPILGIEAYLVDDRLERPHKDEWEGTGPAPSDFKETANAKYKEDASRLRDYYHLVLFAQNDVGLRNLWAMSTESYRDGHYFKPRMDWETLRRHSEGVIASSACLRGPVCHPLLQGKTATAKENIGKLAGIFGDRFYLEIMPNELEDQKTVNQFLVEQAELFNLPLVATVDSHYPTHEDHESHDTWVALQTQSDVNDDIGIFEGDLGLYLKTEAQVRDELSYLPAKAVDEAIANTVKIARSCEVSLTSEPEPPVYGASVEEDNKRVRDMCEERWSKLRHPGITDEQYRSRFDYEYDLLARKSFLGYFLMVSEYCRWAKHRRILVGPGRGSGAASIIAYLLDITEVDPLGADLPFERFMTEGRTELPDFDVDFPASKKAEMLGHLRERYGEDYVISIGTHLRLKSKGIIRDLGRALRSVLLSDIPEHQIERRAARNVEIDTDLSAISKIIEDAESSTAGLGYSWDELWDLYGVELTPYRERYPQIFDMADKLVGRLKSYGKHAAGVVISTDKKLTDWLPLRRGDDESEQMISQFDMGALMALGLIKFDILTIRTLDTVQGAIDLIKERGVDVDVYSWADEYNDPMIWESLSESTVGVFQVETHAGTRLTERMKPTSLDEMCDMTTLVRPGPSRAGLTDMYLRRRDGLEIIDFPDERLAEALAKTWGAIIYQDQIMKTVSLLAGYTMAEADGIRSILGKKKVDKIAAAGQEFVSRAVDWGGMDFNVATDLWEQMAEFSKYSFNKAHAYSYAMITVWTLWLRTHYPVEYLTACLSTVDKDRIPEFIKESRKLGIKVLPPDINLSGKGFKAETLAIRYGLDAIKGVGEKAVQAIVEGQPYVSFLDYQMRKGSAAHSGVTLLMAKVGAFDQLEPARKGLVTMLEDEKSGVSSQCIWKREGALGPLTDGAPDVCGFDWSSEPRPVNKRTLKLLKPKPLPKKCTKACRSYTAPTPEPPSSAAPFSPEEIMEIETELMGMALTYSPFDRLNPEDRKTLLEQAEDISSSGTIGVYTIAAIIAGVKKTRTKAMQEEMAIVEMETEVDVIRAAIFPKLWADVHRDISKGRMVLAMVDKNDRGFSIKAIIGA